MYITDSIKKHNEREKVSFHMPGHKIGRAFDGCMDDLNIFKIDTTELSDTDCLQCPSDFIKAEEDRIAKIYGAEHSFFLVNGSTCGILAMFFACFKDGDKVILSRDCHKSVINAMVFTGVKPIYLSPQKNSKGLYCGISAEDVEDAFIENPDCKGVFITSPSYYGIMSDVEGISKITKKYGALLLCDEAHGAHFPFSDKFPKAAISLGADVSVVSLHKTMPCVNQTAVLNLGKCRVNKTQMQNAINMFQTTSPSYVLLSLMEKAVDTGVNEGEKLTEKLLNIIPERKNLYYFDDPLKVIIDFSEKGFSGQYVMKILEKKYGIYCEMTELSFVLLVLSWYNVKEDFTVLNEALNYISTLPDKTDERINTEYVTVGSKALLTPREVFNSEVEKIEVEKAAGRIAAREVTSFPPCIPYFMPGEEINDNHIKHIKYSIEKKIKLSGVDEENRIFVVKNN